MGFRKPFEAVPIKLGQKYRDQRDEQLTEARADGNRAMLLLALVGVAVGASLGLAWLALKPNLPQTAQTVVQSLSEAPLLGRRRLPQAGDHWGGCNSARAAGSAPIFAGEPGYRSEMDGDGDGVACEPIPY